MMPGLSEKPTLQEALRVGNFLNGRNRNCDPLPFPGTPKKEAANPARRGKYSIERRFRRAAENYISSSTCILPLQAQRFAG